MQTSLFFSDTDTNELGSLLCMVREDLANYFATPAQGLCSGTRFHVRVLALVDEVIARGSEANEETRRSATKEARRWVGKLAADLGEDAAVKVFALREWDVRMAAFPVPFCY